MSDKKSKAKKWSNKTFLNLNCDSKEYDECLKIARVYLIRENLFQ